MMAKRAAILAALLASCGPAGAEVELRTGSLVAVGADGTGCTGAGWSWDLATKTCRMTANLVNQGVSITEDGVTLDCNYWTICRVQGTACTDPLDTTVADQSGISVVSDRTSPPRRGVTIRNCLVHGFDYAAVNINFTEGTHVVNLKTTGLSIYNPAPATTWAQRIPHVALRVTNTNDSLFEQVDISGASDSAVELVYGNFNGNTFRGMKLRNVLGHGLVVNPQGQGYADRNTFEDLDIEAADSRAGVAIVLVGRNDYATVRRAYVHPKWGTSGAFLQGAYLGLGSVGGIVEDSTFVGLKQAGIVLPPSADPPTAIVRGNTVTASGGGVSAGGAVTLQDNVFCNDPALRFQSTIAGLQYADINVRHTSVGTSGRVWGSGNTCGTANDCSVVNGAIVCTDGAYQDIDHAPGAPCAKACP